jgi:hypothetical protein
MACSNFRLIAKTLVQRRDQLIDVDEASLFVGLMTQCPTPEGTSLQEADRPGYFRQQLKLAGAPGPAGLRSPRNLNAVTFRASALRSQATHGAIFDLTGNLLAYGWLQLVAGSDPDTVAFAPGEIQLAYR